MKILDKQYVKWERNKHRLTPYFCDFWISWGSTISHTSAFLSSLTIQTGTDIRLPSSYFTKYWYLKIITNHHLLPSSFHKRMNWYQNHKMDMTWEGKCIMKKFTILFPLFSFSCLHVTTSLCTGIGLWAIISTPLPRCIPSVFQHHR